MTSIVTPVCRAVPGSPGSLRASPNLNGSHNPYHSDSEHEDGAQSLSLPPAYTDVPMAPPGTVHTRLLGICKFFQVPYIAPRADVRPLPEQTHSIFVGQIRFEVEAQQLRWILRRVAGITALKIEPRGLGCYLVHLRTEDEVSALRHLHKRLLFDTTGVWYARTAEEVDAMQAHISESLPVLSRRFRLPRDSMVVEEQKGRSAEGGGNGGGGGGGGGGVPRHHGHGYGHGGGGLQHYYDGGSAYYYYPQHRHHHHHHQQHHQRNGPIAADALQPQHSFRTDSSAPSSMGTTPCGSPNHCSVQGGGGGRRGTYHHHQQQQHQHSGGGGRSQHLAASYLSSSVQSSCSDSPSVAPASPATPLPPPYTLS